jgi:hypothetical protein
VCSKPPDVDQLRLNDRLISNRFGLKEIRIVTMRISFFMITPAQTGSGATAATIQIGCDNILEARSEID